ncbi:hypothetical protein [Gemella morbillorum]
MITFKNKKSDSLGIVFNEIPNIPTGKKRTQFFTVPGRDGKLTVEDDSLEPVQITLEGHAECTRDELINYFRGEGNLIFDVLPDRYYEAKNVEGVNIAYPLGDTRVLKFLVALELEPYSRPLNNPLVTLEKISLIENNTNMIAKPYLKITGNGTITLKRNSVQFLEIKNVVGYVEINGEMDFISKGTLSMERNAIGEVLILKEGQNHLEVIGDVTKVEIRYNWRYR